MVALLQRESAPTMATSVFSAADENVRYILPPQVPAPFVNARRFSSHPSQLGSSSATAGDDPHQTIGRITGAGGRPPRPLQQGSILRFSPLLAGAPAHHVNVEQLGKMRHVMLGHN